MRKPANDAVRYPLEDPRGCEGLPPVTLEVFITFDEWTRIRQLHEANEPRPTAFYDAVRAVLGEQVCERLTGEVVGFRPVPLDAGAPLFEFRFARPGQL